MARINPKQNKKIFTDDVLAVLPSNRNINIGVANAKKAEDPDWQKATKEGAKKRSKDPNWKKKNTQATRKLAKSQNWKIAQKQGIQKSVKTEEWKNNHKQGIKQRKNTDWVENVKRGAIKREQQNTFNRKELNRKTFASKKWQDAMKRGMKDRWDKPKNLSTCPHCGKTCDNANYKKWHGNNCKKAPK